MLASSIILSVRLEETGTIACFLDGPLVVGCIFFPLLFSVGNVALWISSILLFGRAGKASLILRIFEADEVACAYDRGEEFFVLPAAFLRVILAFSNSFFERREGIGGGTFLTVQLLGSPPLAGGMLTLLNFVMMLSLMGVSSEVVSWSQPDSKMAEMNSQADSPNVLS